MPHWNDPPTQTLGNAIAEAQQRVSDQIADDPPFEEVTGLPIQDLTNHATEAIMTMVKNSGIPDDINVDKLVQLYCMGFVIGMKYGEQRQLDREGQG